MFRADSKSDDQKPTTFDTLPDDSLKKDQMKIFNGKDHHYTGCKIKHFLCEDRSIWESLLRGEGIFWQQQLLKNDEFKIENSKYSAHNNRSDKLYKSGNLLYLYGGGGKGSYEVEVYLISQEDNAVQLKKFLTVDCERYSLPEDVRLLPFNPTEGSDATCVSSGIEKYSADLKKIADQISSFIWDLSMGKNVEPNTLSQYIEVFDRELKIAYIRHVVQDSRYSTDRQNNLIQHYLSQKSMLQYDAAVLQKAHLQEIKPTPDKKVIFPKKFFACGYDEEKRTQIQNLISDFLQKQTNTKDLHIFGGKSLWNTPAFTIASSGYFEDIEKVAKKMGVICWGYGYGGSDGHPKKSRADFTCFETDKDIDVFREFLNWLQAELNPKPDVKMAR